MTIKNNYIVKKNNVLNEMRANNMSLQELRFFSIYLSKINANNIQTRVVKFPVVDFQSIMDLGRLNILHMKSITNGLLSKVVNIPTERGGYEAFQLFKECRVDEDDNGEWYVEIDAHDKALPLMFEFKEKYFTYQLWNALRLKSVNQLRMYEILKQCEYKSIRIISVQDLKEMLGIGKDEYALYKNFRVFVLDACQKALEENTDIKFTYKPYGKKGKGGKILQLEFFIEKNEKYCDPLILNQFIKPENKPEKIENAKKVTHYENANDGEMDVFHKKLRFLAESCDNEFTIPQIQILYNLMTQILTYYVLKDEIKCYNYLKCRYDELKWRAEKTDIKNRFSYMKKILQSQLDEQNSFINFIE